MPSVPKPADFPPEGMMENDASVAEGMRSRGLPVISAYGPYYAARAFDVALSRAGLTPREAERAGEVMGDEAVVNALQSANDLAGIDAAAEAITARVRALPPLDA